MNLSLLKKHVPSPGYDDTVLTSEDIKNIEEARKDVDIPLEDVMLEFRVQDLLAKQKNTHAKI